MSVAPAVVRPSPTRSVAAPRLTVLSNVWQAPLVPVALAGTAGIVLDRRLSIPLAGSLLAAAVFLIAWGIGRLGGTRGLALVYLWLSVGALGAAYHHWYRELIADDDIGHLASEEPRLARLRGEVASEPTFVRGQAAGPLRAIPGNVPQLDALPSGCRFHPRCPKAQADCSQKVPGLIEVESNRWVRCPYWKWTWLPQS